MPIRVALVLGLAALAPREALAPSLTADLDGDGSVEIVTALSTRGTVRVEVRGEDGTKAADAKAPAPAAEVEHVTLTSAPLGSVGSLLEVSASADASKCVSIWRYRERTLKRLPIRGADGKDLPDCGLTGEWTDRWERESESRPSVLVRERTEKVAQGVFRIQDVYAFAAFSLDYDPKLSARQINGVPIPSWYGATLYTRAALEKLYGRFDLASLKSEPTLSILTDRERGVFALRFTGPGGEVVVPIDAFAATPASQTASVSGRVGGETAHVSIRLGGDGSIPYEARVEGLGPRLDQRYSPAGSWRGGARQVFLTAADEVVSEDLVGVWNGREGRRTMIAIEGAPPYRVRVGQASFTIDLEHATQPADLLLLPVDASGRPWGIVLQGPNAIDRIPLSCSGEGAGRACRADGEGERLRRIGALVNVR